MVNEHRLSMELSRYTSVSLRILGAFGFFRSLDPRRDVARVLFLATCHWYIDPSIKTSLFKRNLVMLCLELFAFTVRKQYLTITFSHLYYSLAIGSASVNVLLKSQGGRDATHNYKSDDIAITCALNYLYYNIIKDKITLKKGIATIT